MIANKIKDIPRRIFIRPVKSTIEELSTTIDIICKDQAPGRRGFVLACTPFITNNLWKSVKPEGRLQMLVMAWIRHNYPDVLVTHYPNEGKRTEAGRYFVLYMGIKKGMPDVMIYQKITKLKHDPPMLCTYCGLALELKIGYNKPTDEQIDRLTELDGQCWETHILYDFPKAIKAVMDYLGPPK